MNSMSSMPVGAGGARGTIAFHIIVYDRNHNLVIGLKPKLADTSGPIP